MKIMFQSQKVEEGYQFKYKSIQLLCCLDHTAKPSYPTTLSGDSHVNAKKIGPIRSSNGCFGTMSKMNIIN